MTLRLHLYSNLDMLIVIFLLVPPPTVHLSLLCWIATAKINAPFQSLTKSSALSQFAEQWTKEVSVNTVRNWVSPCAVLQLFSCLSDKLGTLRKKKKKKDNLEFLQSLEPTWVVKYTPVRTWVLWFTEQYVIVLQPKFLLSSVTRKKLNIWNFT